MAAGADLIERGEVGDFFQVREAAGVNDRHADVVDPLVADEVVRVPDGVEDFADGDGCSGVFTDELEAFLMFGGGGVFEPEKMKVLEFFAETRRFNRREAMMAVVEQV